MYILLHIHNHVHSHITIVPYSCSPTHTTVEGTCLPTYLPVPGTYLSAHLPTSIHAYTYAHMCIYIYIYIYIKTHIYICTCMHACIYVSRCATHVSLARRGRWNLSTYLPMPLVYYRYPLVGLCICIKLAAILKLSQEHLDIFCLKAC